MKTFAALATATLIAGAGLLWILSNPVVIVVKHERLKPSAELPTFHQVTVDPPRSDDADRDPARDGLRDALLTAADNLKSDPCNPTLKARYIEAASQICARLVEHRAVSGNTQLRPRGWRSIGSSSKSVRHGP